MKKIDSQCDRIARHLATSGSISFAEAWDAYGVRCLPRRIKDLREQGYVIQSETKSHSITKQRYVRYHLVAQPALPAVAA